MAENATEALEAAARALADAHYQLPDEPWVTGSAWDDPPVPPSAVTGWREGWRKVAQLALAAASPYLIAEGRRQAAREIVDREEREGDYDNTGVAYFAALEIAESAGPAERDLYVAEGLSPAERAEQYLRESRQRQAGLDMERIERARNAQAGSSTQREV